MKNFTFNPFKLYLFWIILCLVFVLVIPFLSANEHSSAQIPFALGTYALISLVCGIFAISILNMFLFRNWVSKFWYINFPITILTGGIIIYFFIKMITL